jgi:hypothetical protein
MNKKESGATRRLAQHRFVTERRQQSFGRVLYIHFISICVGKALTRTSRPQVNATAVGPLDDLLLASTMEQGSQA